MKKEDVEEVRRALQPEVRAKRYARLEALGAFVRHLPLPSSIYAALAEIIECEGVDEALPWRTVEKMKLVEEAAAELTAAVLALEAVVPAVPIARRAAMKLVAKAFEGEGQPVLETLRSEIYDSAAVDDQFEDMALQYDLEHVEEAVLVRYLAENLGVDAEDVDVSVELSGAVREPHRHARYLMQERIVALVHRRKAVSA